MSTQAQWRILIIDDEPDVREVVALALADDGYTVATASDGQAGVEQCRRFDPQIVLTDIRMPHMDGIQVLTYLKRHHPEIEVIVATAFADIPLAIQALQLDASDFLTKPLDHGALQTALARGMERYTSRRQLRDYMQLLEKENARTARELEYNIDFQRNLIDSSMDAILGCDAQERIMAANRSMSQLTGIPKEQMIGALRLSSFFPADELARMHRELDSEGFGGKNRLALFATELLDARQQRVPVHVSAARLFENDQPAGLVLVLRDLREFRRLENALEDQAHTLHQDKMIAMGRLAASVVHEINNPLAGILNYVKLMRKGLGHAPAHPAGLDKFARYLELVEQEISRCSHITANLLAFTRKSPPSFEKVFIHELVKRTLLLCGHKLEMQKIETHVDVAENLAPVAGDANQLQQCLLNLIFNAMDAMPSGGRMDIAARLDDRRHRLILKIRDTGSGIADKDLPYIFDPFFTTKQQGYGVGLGLSTVRGIVHRHGGEIRVEQTSSSGTAVRVELPVR
jgi:two-component system, NtrC family, sensor kinase